MLCTVKKKKIYPAYVSKRNLNCETEVILLIIPNGKGWHYPAIKKNLALLRGATCKHHGDFYSLNCLHSFSTKNKLELHKKVCGNINFCNVIMPYKDTKILEFNQNQKPFGFSMTTISSFKSIENKHNVCRGKDCMKIFCESLREHAIKKINLKKKK